MIRHFACIFAVAIFLHSVGASAATPSWGRTIEANAALADVVVVGRLQSVAPSDAPQVFQDGAHSLLASIDVQKCLKGTATSPVTFSAVAVQDRLPQSAIYFLMAGTRYAAVIDRSAGKIPWVLQQKYLCFDYADLTQTASHGVVNTDLVDGLSAGRLIELVQAHCSNGVCPQYEEIMSFFGDYHRWPFLLEVPIDEPMQAVAGRWATSSDGSTRWNAGLVLRHHRSAESIAALTHIATAGVDSSDSWFARELALDQLQRWAIPLPAVARSIAAESFLGCLCVVAGLLVPVVDSRLRRQRGKTSPSRKQAALASIATTLIFLCVASFYKSIGFIAGHSEIGIWKTDLVYVHREHVAIIRSEPFRFASETDLWTLRSYFSEYSGWLPRLFGDGVLDGGAEAMPCWNSVIGIAIPLWIPIVLLLLSPAIWLAIKRMRVRLDGRRRGFPISVSNLQSSADKTA